MTVLAKALRDDTDFKLEMELVAGAAGLRREIDHVRTQRPGLALTGFIASIQSGRMQVVGTTEVAYLASLDVQARRTAVDFLGVVDVPCLVVTSGLTAPSELVALCERLEIPLFRTSLVTHVFTTRVHQFLDEHLAPEVSLHGVLLDVFGVGVLLTGPSGIGKSECALDLVLRGHRLVADDVIQVKRRAGYLEGYSPDVTKHHMEVRGLGIINAGDLFGAASVRERKRVELVVEMVDWRNDDQYDRLGIDDLHEIYLEVAVAKVRIPIRPGRNVASIVEVASRNQLLKLRGHNAAAKFKEALERRLMRGAMESE
ncbi:MAG: HPr(Ser) kinase/phosphatase [Clostridia bacterium]|nr:HPr(Ser) kinase/phosphatase [Deltaproteobacteria bacterium]